MGAVAKVQTDQSPLSTDVRRMESQFKLALPEHVSPERFVRVVVTAIQSNPDLQKADRESVLGAALKCAQDGLVPDGREAALVVYGNKAAYLPMIAGILAKVRRSGELRTISAHVVYEKDVFLYVLGDDESIEHKPLMDGPRGKAIAVYAVAKTKDGGIYREVMSLEEVNQVRNVSRAKNNGPWVTWWGEMARKTVLRRLSKRLPMSTDLQQVFQRDDDHYDLRQAEGAARLRRLHDGFEDPEPALAEPTTAEFTDTAPEAPADLDTTLNGDDLPAGMKTGAQVLAEQEAARGDDQGRAGLETPADGQGSDLLSEIDVIGWAGQLLRSLGGYAGRDVLMADFKEHAAELKAKSPGLHRELALACDARAKEIEADNG